MRAEILEAIKMHYHDNHDSEPVASREAAVTWVVAVVFVSALLLLLDVAR